MNEGRLRVEAVVCNWDSCLLDELVGACSEIHGARYLLLQRAEVIELARKHNKRAMEIVEEMISISDYE